MILGAWLLTAMVLFYVEENWRGRRAWNRVRENLVARGKPLDLRQITPKPVPDEQNFAATPFVESWFTKRGQGVWGDLYSEAASQLSSASTGGSGKGGRTPVDLAGWKLAMAAHEVVDPGPDSGDRACLAGIWGGWRFTRSDFDRLSW